MFNVICSSVDEAAKEKLAPFSTLTGDESYQSRDLEKVRLESLAALMFRPCCIYSWNLRYRLIIALVYLRFKVLPITIQIQNLVRLISCRHFHFLF